MRVVSKTSPLSNLGIIGRLELLEEQFGTIWTPQAVSEELGRLDHRGAQEGLFAARESGWLKEQRLRNNNWADVLSGQLDRGEAEAIALGMEMEADRVLIDERDGRLIARQAGLQVTGILGVLLKAKQKGQIGSLRAEMDRLRQEARFFIRKDLEAELLTTAGE